ncbi:MAG: DnaJ domain-containing protein [Nitrosomonas sp.]|nr:DnaJ domain-containing protein [Nitrosomonas sp.]
MALPFSIRSFISLKYLLTSPLTIKTLLSHNHRYNHAMQNRRNFYRILQAQPDAPMEVIRNNYRTLLQKLRLHPDLGGDHSHASLVNQAWHTLRDPVRRRAYDHQLLQDYHIQTLSQGYLAGNPFDRDYGPEQTLSNDINQRNYYRILNIQTDASAAIIDPSYRLQIKKPHVAIALLQEAYAVLSDPEKRKAYDKFLQKNTHIIALKKKMEVNEKPAADLITAAKPFPAIQPSSNNLSNSLYQPIISHYCDFCKTPHAINSIKYYFEICLECGSPLFNASDEDGQQLQRKLSRINRDGDLEIYTEWPGRAYCGNLTNLSPGGLGFTTSQILQPNQLIKIDSEHFKCIAKVMHCQDNFSGKSIGSCFITVLFNRQQGTFISTQA